MFVRQYYCIFRHSEIKEGVKRTFPHEEMKAKRSNNAEINK